jgi:undecaprenyl-diphosphatase
VVQGLTEFFPVSSTAHLVLFPWFFGWRGEVDSLTFDIAVHGGTLCALAACFYRDWLTFLTKDRRMLITIFLATLPALAAGYFLHDYADSTLRNPVVIAGSLVAFGFVMLAAERFHAVRSQRASRVNAADALTMGIAQAIAIIPGVSRSGITITAGLFSGLSRHTAARFSFLLSTPTIAAAFLFGAYKFRTSAEPYHIDVFAAGFLAALVSGYLAIQFLMSFLRKHPMNVFVYYRFILAALILAVWAFAGIRP